MRPISLAVGLLICSLSLNGQSKGQPIIDMHQHARFKVWLDAKGNPYPRLCFPAPCEQVPAEAKEGPDILKIALEEMAKYNVVKAVVSDGNLSDVSTISWLIPEKTFYNYLKGLIDNGLEKRLMYGSDQMEYPEAIGIGIERISTADFLSKKQKRDIFYNNAARFLRLSDQEIKAHHK